MAAWPKHWRKTTPSASPTLGSRSAQRSARSRATGCSPPTCYATAPVRGEPLLQMGRRDRLVTGAARTRRRSRSRADECSWEHLFILEGDAGPERTFFALKRLRRDRAEELVEQAERQQSEGTTNALAAPHPRPDAAVLIKMGARSARMAYSYRVHWEQNVEPAN